VSLAPLGAAADSAPAGARGWVDALRGLTTQAFEFYARRSIADNSRQYCAANRDVYATCVWLATKNTTDEAGYPRIPCSAHSRLRWAWRLPKSGRQRGASRLSQSQDEPGGQLVPDSDRRACDPTLVGIRLG